MGKWPTFQKFGAHGVLIQWENSIDENIHAEVLMMNSFIQETYSKVIIETVPAYQSLAVYLKTRANAISFIKELKSFKNITYKVTSEEKRILTIPVCYHPDYGMDIGELASLNDLSVTEVINLHTKPLYKVYFLGFLPGFPYLGGMDTRLITPRRDTPRTYIPSGSVGIGGRQTGIYTMNSPGGWNVIGKTPLSFFSIEKSPHTLLNAGDLVKFKAISRRDYAKIEIAVDTGSYGIETEVGYD